MTETNETPRPDFVTDNLLRFLDELRESSNMLGSLPFIKEKYPELTDDQAEQVFIYWMRTFGQRHPS